MKTFPSAGRIGLFVQFIIASGENVRGHAPFWAKANGATGLLRKGLNCATRDRYRAGVRLCIQLADASFCSACERAKHATSVEPKGVSPRGRHETRPAREVGD